MKYRKKPIVIEAVRLTPIMLLDHKNWPDWFVRAMKTKLTEPGAILWFNGSLAVHTLEGLIEGKIGDWIIQDIQGKIYPCKPDIFDATYEAVT